MTYQLLVFQPGDNAATAVPFYSLDIPPEVLTINDTQTLPSNMAWATNPKEIWWTQPVELPGQVCKADLSGQADFLAIPQGGPYPFALVATDVGGSSPRGIATQPFLRTDAPLAPSGVRAK